MLSGVLISAQLLAILETFGVLGVEFGRRGSSPAQRHEIVLGGIDAMRYSHV